MIGLDTNIIIRYLVQDDEIQSKKATHYIEKNCKVENPGFLNSVVICEIFWVLETSYKYSKLQIYQTIENLLKCPQIELENADAVLFALLHYKKSNAWMSGEITGVQDDVDVFDPEDSTTGRITKNDSINAVQIYLLKK